MGIDLHSALHATGGNATNHFHWLLEIVPKLRVDPFAPSISDGVVLLPPVETAAQSEILALLKGHANPLLLLGDEHAVRVRSLVLVPNLAGYGFAPNPHLRSYFARLKQLLRIEVPRNRRIYVTRRDSENRVLKNEADVMDLVDGYGFQSVELTGLSLRDQALLFASASHLISPQGAGLANLIFCDEGTFLCELQMHSYLHPRFRRLAAIQRVRYGCVIGYPDPRADAQSWVHDQQWTVPLDRLEAALRQMTRSLDLSTASTRRAMPAQDFVGNLEPAQTDLIGGWVFGRDSPGVALELHIHIDGKWIATVPTSRSRPDVEAVFPGGRNAGFEFAIPPYLRDGKLHLVNVTIAGSDLVLPGCPFIYEYSHFTPEPYPHFSLNGESPICSDIGDFAETSPAADEVPHVWLDKQYAVQPIDPIRGGNGEFQPALPYVISFPRRYANTAHGTVFNRNGEIWQGCCYLRDSDQIVVDQALIRGGASGVPNHGRIVVFATSMRDNYFHWHLDCLTGLRYIARHSDLSDAIVLGPALNPWQRDSLKLLGVINYVESGALVYAENILTTAYTDGRGIFPDANVAETFRYIRSQADSVTTEPARTSHELLFVSRADATVRVLENENELWVALAKRGFHRIVPSQLSYLEQIAAFSRARVVVATHGAGMTNIGFANPGIKIHEIRHHSYANPCFEHLGLLLGHRYHLYLINGDVPDRLDVASFVSHFDDNM
jgi:capsular polysaccharide biosynthesis protein